MWHWEEYPSCLEEVQWTSSYKIIILNHFYSNLLFISEVAVKVKISYLIKLYIPVHQISPTLTSPRRPSVMKSWSWHATLQTTVPAWPHRSSGCIPTTCLIQSLALNTWQMTTLRCCRVLWASHPDLCTMGSCWVAGSIIPTPLWCMRSSSHWTSSVS